MAAVANQCGFGDAGSVLGREANTERRRARGPSVAFVQFERAIYDFLASLVLDDFFGRFPNIRVASVENGAEFLPDMFRKLRSARNKMPMLFDEDPVETFKQNIWINPFWEDDVNEVVDCMGADRVIFGSDWPHIEGMQQPLDYLPELKAFDDDDQRQHPARQRRVPEHTTNPCEVTMATPIEIVTQFCDQVAGGDAAKAADFFSDDAMYHNIPLDPVNGRDAIRDTIGMFLGMADKVWFDTLHIVADGPIVMTERIDHFAQGDRDIALPVMGTFEVSDGKITAWRDYFDMEQFTNQMSPE